MSNDIDKTLLNIKDNDYPLFESIKKHFKRISQNRIFIYSFALSSLMSLRYLQNKEIYRENFGHFNSPQNLLNRRMTQHHTQDAFARLILGFFVFSAGFSFIKYYLAGYDDIDDTNIEEKTNNIIVNLGDKKVLEFDEIYENPETDNELYNNRDILKSRDIVKNYKAQN